MLRTVHHRVRDRSGTWTIDNSSARFNLLWAAWGAAVETLQIDLVASGWTGLFTALLEPSPSTNLRWLHKGPGVNAEIKRAYSALFGRFFARATLRQHHGCRWLYQVEEDLEISPGFFLRRRPRCGGDLPDWVGWDDHNQCFVVAEAKGSYAAGVWDKGQPAIIGHALKQIRRVQIVDAAGRDVHFKSWAVASRWGTSVNGLTPMLVSVDPEAKGRKLEPEEAHEVRQEVRARWVASLLDGLARPDLAAMTRRVEVATEADPIETDLASFPGRSGYAALAITGSGILPLVGRGRGARATSMIDFATDLGRDPAVILLNRDEVERATIRFPFDAEEQPGPEEPIVDGKEITVDGLTFRADTSDVNLVDETPE